jgi:hypothetical protein
MLDASLTVRILPQDAPRCQRTFGRNNPAPSGVPATARLNERKSLSALLNYCELVLIDAQPTSGWLPLSPHGRLPGDG